MNFQFESLNYNVFIVDETMNDETFFQDIINILADNEVNNLPPYFYNVDTYEDAKDWLEFITSQADLLFMQGKYSLETIGFIFVHTNESNEAHLGYVLAREYWNKGIATEVLLEFMKYADESKRWECLRAGVEKGNDASIHLLEKLGFSLKDEGSMALFYEYKI